MRLIQNAFCKWLSPLFIQNIALLQLGPFFRHTFASVVWALVQQSRLFEIYCYIFGACYSTGESCAVGNRLRDFYGFKVFTFSCPCAERMVCRARRHRLERGVRLFRSFPLYSFFFLFEIVLVTNMTSNRCQISQSSFIWILLLFFCFLFLFLSL